MKNYNLGFISDENLFKQVKETVEKYRFEINLESFNKNIIDPIKLTFDSKIYGKNINAIIATEILRQIDKSNTNHIGYFHQNIFRYLGGTDWIVPKEGFDIINNIENIYVEMKNKHNTMNSSSSQKTYMVMQNKILKNINAQCFLVEVIAKDSQNIPWLISLNKQKMSDNRIRRISIDKFYEIVTKDKFAFKKLLEVLPSVLDDVLYSLNRTSVKSSVLKELQELSPNIFKSLYYLAFSKYEGFNNFDI